MRYANYRSTLTHFGTIMIDSTYASNIVRIPILETNLVRSMSCDVSQKWFTDDSSVYILFAAKYSYRKMANTFRKWFLIPIYYL